MEQRPQNQQDNPQNRRPAAHTAQIAYVPVLLRSMNEICKELRVGEETVKDWIRNGAPIAVEAVGGKARYSSELMRLQLWRETSKTCQ